ncbi:MAG TPA: hypothetical protein VIE47_01440 [Methylocystis sp.]
MAFAYVLESTRGRGPHQLCQIQQKFERFHPAAVHLCRVDVFPLQVVRQRKSWPEKDQRVTEWFTPAEAAELVHEPELSELIKAFEAMISRGG